jgi:hypothetical protein
MSMKKLHHLPPTAITLEFSVILNIEERNLVLHISVPAIPPWNNVLTCSIWHRSVKFVILNLTFFTTATEFVFYEHRHMNVSVFPTKHKEFYLSVLFNNGLNHKYHIVLVIHEWVWSTGATTLTGKNQSIQRNTRPSATLYTIKPTLIGPGINPGICIKRSSTTSLSHSITPQVLCKWYNKHTNYPNSHGILNKSSNVNFILNFNNDKMLLDRIHID